MGRTFTRPRIPLLLQRSRIGHPKERGQLPASDLIQTKGSKPVTTRHLATALAEQHQLSKKQGLQMLE
jgi:hypothetical protein